MKKIILFTSTLSLMASPFVMASSQPDKAEAAQERKMEKKRDIKRKGARDKKFDSQNRYASDESDTTSSTTHDVSEAK